MSNRLWKIIGSPDIITVIHKMAMNKISYGWPQLSFLFNWDSPHASLKGHYKALSYKKKKKKMIKSKQESCLEKS